MAVNFCHEDFLSIGREIPISYPLKNSVLTGTLMSKKLLHKLFKNGLWIENILQMRKEGLDLQTTKKQFDEIISNLQRAIEKRRKGKAFNWFVLALALDCEKTIFDIQRKGWFRSSKYNFDTSCLKFVVSAVIKRADEIGLPPAICNYLESVRCLLKVSEQARQIRQRLIGDLKKHSQTVLKSLIVFVDFLFMKEHKGDRNLGTGEVHFYSLEDLSGAASYLIFLFNEYIGVKDKHFDYIDEKAILGSEISALLIEACKLKTLMEQEILVDCFGYTCTEDQYSVIIDSPDEILKKSISLGYILTSANRSSLYHDHPQNDKLSVKDAAEHLDDVFPFVTLRTDPIERFVIEVPIAPALKSILCSDVPFYEEAMILFENGKEQFASLDDLKTFSIMEGLILFDIFVVQRLFNFLRLALNKHLVKKLSSDPEIVVRSLVPRFELKNLSELLQVCLSEETAQKFLEIVTWDRKEEKILDLQYQPIIRGQNVCILPTNIFGGSNVLRNVLYSQRKRLFDNGKWNPLEDELRRSLQQHCGDKVRQIVKYEYGRPSGDIDVIALCGTYLFIFECKNSLLPSGAHEMRASYDSIVKAAEQLNRIQALLEDAKFVDYLFTKLEWQGSTFTDVITCIVTGNRLFSGHRVEGHPVRPIYELCNIFNEGRIVVGEFEYCLWSDGRFDVLKAVEYIRDDAFHSIYFESMVEKEHIYLFGETKLIVSEDALNPEAFRTRVPEFWGAPIDKLQS